MQEMPPMTHHDGVSRTISQTAVYVQDTKWSPRKTFLFIILTSVSVWAAALYPILAN